MNATEDGTEPVGEGPIDTLGATEHAAGADKAAALQQLTERADAHLAGLKRDAARDPYRPASQRALSLPSAIEQAEILAQVVRTVQVLGAVEC